MRVIAHISDLHFGRENSKVAEGLVADLKRLEPVVLVNSGDFTQRARRSQFRSAATFIRRLPCPQINIPGNHDIPLYDIIRRFLKPLDRFNSYITENRFPSYRDERLMVLGINTARSMTWKSGRISEDQIEELEIRLATLPEEVFKVVVTHHPFIPPPGEEAAGVDLVGRAGAGLEVLERYGVDLLLAGHLHHGYTGDIRTHYPASGRSIIVAQAGTAISKRVRFEPNGYNVIYIEPGRLTIEIRHWNGVEFTPVGREEFIEKAADGSLQIYELVDPIVISH